MNTFKTYSVSAFSFLWLETDKYMYFITDNIKIKKFVLVYLQFFLLIFNIAMPSHFM